MRSLCDIIRSLFLLSLVALVYAKEEQLHMIWTTPVATIGPRHLKVLGSYIRHHPDWQVNLYVTDPNWSYWRIKLSHFFTAKYHLNLIYIDQAFLEQLVEGDCRAAKQWVERNEEWQRGKYYYSHLTDLMRFCLLIKKGGIYSDFDALLLKPMPLAEWWNAQSPGAGRTIIGRDRVLEECSWCLPGGIYLAPGVMIAEKGSKLLKEALSIGFDVKDYDPSIFNGCGPKAVTMASKIVPRSSVMQLPTDTFYPVNYKEAIELFKLEPNVPKWGSSVTEIMEKISRKSYSLHFFGGQTRNALIEEGSILDLFGEPRLPDYFVTDGKDTRLFGVNVDTVQKIMIGVDHGSVEPDTCTGESLAAINQCLSGLIFTPDPEYGKSNLEIYMEEPANSIVIPIYNLPTLLTITVKTMDRMHKVFELVSTLRQFYPNIPVIVADDGRNAGKVSAGDKRGFEYLPLPYDTGLSSSRNILVKKVETPLIMILDDDFVFTADSDLGYLVHQLMSKRLDVVAATSPADRDKHGLDYVGLLQQEDGELHLVRGEYSYISGTTCKLVDLVPNIFVARRSRLQDVPWDSNLKLGEHEDWFFRAKEADMKVASCKSVELIHRQDPHWLNKTPYDRMRGRVWGFLYQALLKHSLTRLTVFGMTTMAIQGIIFRSTFPFDHH